MKALIRRWYYPKKTAYQMPNPRAVELAVSFMEYLKEAGDGSIKR